MTNSHILELRLPWKNAQGGFGGFVEASIPANEHHISFYPRGEPKSDIYETKGAAEKAIFTAVLGIIFKDNTGVDEGSNTAASFIRKLLRIDMPAARNIAVAEKFGPDAWALRGSYKHVFPIVIDQRNKDALKTIPTFCAKVGWTWTSLPGFLWWSGADEVLLVSPDGAPLEELVQNIATVEVEVEAWIKQWKAEAKQKAA